MTALLLCMLTSEDQEYTSPGMDINAQSIKFAILCSGFISDGTVHQKLYNALRVEALQSLKTLHTVDQNDPIVSAKWTIQLSKIFNPANTVVYEHNEGIFFVCLVGDPTSERV